jgi:hypothetical protein
MSETGVMNKMSGDEVVGEKEQKRRMERERGGTEEKEPDDQKQQLKVGLSLLEVIFWPRECVEITFRVEIASLRVRDVTRWIRFQGKVIRSLPA